MESIQIDSLPDTDRAFRLDDGRIVAVRVIPQQADKPDENAPSVTLKPRLVDEQGQDVQIGGTPVYGRSRGITIPGSGIAEGKTTLEDILASRIADVVARFRNRIVAREAISSLPKSSTDG